MVVSDSMEIIEIADTEISRLKKLIFKGTKIVSLELELPIHLVDFTENEQLDVLFGRMIEDDDYRFLARGTVFQINLDSDPSRIIGSIGGLRFELAVDKNILHEEKIMDVEEIYLALR